MKKVSLMYTLFILVGLQLVACGPTKQDPLEDYKSLELSENPQPQEKVVYQYVDKEVSGAVVNNYVPVATEVGVTVEKVVTFYMQDQQVVEEITISDYPILVSTTNDKVKRTNNFLYFFEESESTSCIEVKINYNSAVTFDYDINGLPGNLIPTREASTSSSEYAGNSVKYCMKYAAPTGLIGSDVTYIESKVNVAIKDLKFTDQDQDKNKAMETIFNQLSKNRDVPLMIFKNSPEIIQILESGNGPTPTTATPTSDVNQATVQAESATPSPSETTSLAPTTSIRPQTRPSQTQTTSSLAPTTSIRPQTRPTQATNQASSLAPTTSIRPQARPSGGR